MRCSEELENKILLERKLTELSDDNMVKHLCSLVSDCYDKHSGTNIYYSIEEALLGVFSVLLTQSTYFLAFEDTMSKAKGESNAQSLFGTQKIPSDNHIRDMMDVVHPSYAFPMFSIYF